MANRKRKITVCLSNDSIDRLKEYAEKHCISVSTVLQLMVNKAFKKGDTAV